MNLNELHELHEWAQRRRDGWYDARTRLRDELEANFLAIERVLRQAFAYVDLSTEDYQVRGELFRDLHQALEPLRSKEKP